MLTISVFGVKKVSEWPNKGMYGKWKVEAEWKGRQFNVRIAQKLDFGEADQSNRKTFARSYTETRRSDGELVKALQFGHFNADVATVSLLLTPASFHQAEV